MSHNTNGEKCMKHGKLGRHRKLHEINLPLYCFQYVFKCVTAITALFVTQLFFSASVFQMVCVCVYVHACAHVCVNEEEPFNVGATGRSADAPCQ